MIEIFFSFQKMGLAIKEERRKENMTLIYPLWCANEKERLKVVKNALPFIGGDACMGSPPRGYRTPSEESLISYTFFYEKKAKRVRRITKKKTKSFYGRAFSKRGGETVALPH